jgi:DNA helicase HerA-like ATPase
MVPRIHLGNAQQPVYLNGAMANRHGLIAGATGTGKTVTLQAMAEGFAALGVPVFMADVKGDLSGIAAAGGGNDKVAKRAEEMGLEGFAWRGNSVTFWDILGRQGHPARATISDMGPLLLARMLKLNDTQEGVLNLTFRVADDKGWLLLDLKDLRSMLQYVSENAREFRTLYGNISSASVGAIQRRLIGLEEQGGDKLFGEPALNLDDMMQTDGQGRGVINLLAADELMASPQLYSAFLLWLLAELFERLPEAGDRDRPKFVLFFDEAHLLFDDAPDVLLDKIERVVRLIRSKGVGVYFVTQNPLDIPDQVLGQLGNRVQHALRAYTPRDQKAVKAAAQTFRANPELDTAKVITELGVGMALVSTLDEEGRPTVVERTMMRPPASQLGPISPKERSEFMANSLVAGVYEEEIDRESAYEILAERAEQEAAAEAATPPPPPSRGSGRGSSGKSSGGRRGDSAMEAFLKSAARSVGSQVGRQIVRGLMGSLFGGKR